MANELKIRLKRGTAGKPDWVKDVIRGLGFRKTYQTIVCKDTPAIRGMIFKVIQYLEVKRV